MLEKANLKFKVIWNIYVMLKAIKNFFYGLLKSYKTKRLVQLAEHNCSIIYVGLNFWLTEAKENFLVI